MFRLVGRAPTRIPGRHGLTSDTLSVHAVCPTAVEPNARRAHSSRALVGAVLMSCFLLELTNTHNPTTKQRQRFQEDLFSSKLKFPPNRVIVLQVKFDFVLIERSRFQRHALSVQYTLFQQ